MQLTEWARSNGAAIVAFMRRRGRGTTGLASPRLVGTGARGAWPHRTGTAPHHQVRRRDA
ncbi:hypothetical protein RM863_18315 [Streptomyces sp. DSM 41014]|uniref:Uncharacterized protein n=1 Tax=Streptomyces hintoniae TaxID=3075521 RepID=A0ABU2UM01_9ACTN|nr:hypothetical protein [Streptomyces sp. DSM 41014]MDT0474084.1 hypothetical protein [Streptomyces sp. DSM 41014]